MFLYYAYLMIFSFMPISYLFAPPEADFASEGLERTDSIETIAHRQHTEPIKLFPQHPTVEPDELLSKKNNTDPELTAKLKATATAKYKGKFLFKDTRTQRYVNLAQKLPTEIQQLLVDLSNKKTSSTTFQSSSKNTLDDVQTAIDTVNAAKKGSLWEGEHSSGLLDDLKNLKSILEKRNLTPIERQRETGAAKSWQEYVNRWAKHEKEQEEIAQRDKNVRFTDRQNAIPATAEDYIADSAFDITDQKNPKFNPNNVVDAQHNVLTQQLNSLQTKLAELLIKKGYDASNNEDNNDPQIEDLKKEIATIHKDLTAHHVALHYETNSIIDSLTRREKELESPSYLIRQPIFFRDGNRYNVGEGKLYDLEERVKKLARQEDSLAKKIKGHQSDIGNKRREQNQISTQIRSLEQENSKINVNIRDLQSKVATIDNLLKQSFAERIVTESKEGGSVKAAKGFIDTGKATAKLSDSALKQQREELTKQLHRTQNEIAEKSADIATLRATYDNLATQIETLETNQATLKQQQTEAKEEHAKNEAWLQRETTQLDQHRKQRLEEIKSELKKARAASIYHKSVAQDHKSTTAVQP